MLTCDSFDWNGATYTESGTYTFATTNAVGCVHYFKFNNNNSSSSEENATACEVLIGMAQRILRVVLTLLSLLMSQVVHIQLL